jgi:hypothetical protein
MSLTIKGRGGEVTIGGERDHGGTRGTVMLWGQNAAGYGSLVLLTPAEARQVARALMRFADRARKVAAR